MFAQAIEYVCNTVLTDVILWNNLENLEIVSEIFTPLN